MLSTTILATALLSAATTFASPLLERSTSSPACYPNISAEHTTAIAPQTNLNYAWTIFEDSAGKITNVSIRNAHDIYEGIKYNNNFVISQPHPKSGSLPKNEYRLTSAVVNGVQECIAAASSSKILSAPCTSKSAAWTFECTTCDTSLYGNGDRCLIKSTKYGTCATVAKNLEISLTKCSNLNELTRDNGTSGPAFVPLNSFKGNQAWRIV
ncbi:uncharacterized protein JCM15063_005441 [Sporobolomyces koalae]|uniref:uncharacterized protein n=1 Tax=Sporobolomyces koalae TaxID=500713 RepID=UPI0031802F54